MYPKSKESAPFNLKSSKHRLASVCFSVDSGRGNSAYKVKGAIEISYKKDKLPLESVLEKTLVFKCVWAGEAAANYT